MQYRVTYLKIDGTYKKKVVEESELPEIGKKLRKAFDEGKIKYWFKEEIRSINYKEKLK